MTIVYCIFSLAQPGGMQRVLTVKANYLADIEGLSIHIVTQAATGESPHFPLSPNITLHHTGQTNYKQTLASLLYAIRPDITISLYGEESRWLYKIGDGSKKILEFHFTRHHLEHLVDGLPNVGLRPVRRQYARVLQYLDVRCAPHYEKLVLLTECDKRLWGNPSNAVVIPNPLSFTCDSPSDLGQQRILAAGRLIATKGFDLLIEAYIPLASQFPDWTLTILGEGQDKAFLEDKIRRAGLQDRIGIVPPVPEIKPEMLKSSIYAASSRYEGFGLVITEAMECGVPCVAFDCECGPREIITNGVDGMLVEALNVERFREALRRLMTSLELRRWMAKNARGSARRFAHEKIMQQWLSLFYSLIQHKQPADVR